MTRHDDFDYFAEVDMDKRLRQQDEAAGYRHRCDDAVRILTDYTEDDEARQHALAVLHGEQVPT